MACAARRAMDGGGDRYLSEPPVVCRIIYRDRMRLSCQLPSSTVTPVHLLLSGRAVSAAF